MGELLSIVYKPKNASGGEEDYLRVPLTQTRLVVDYGIVGDAKGGSPKRQLNLMAAESLQQLAQEGFRTAPGQMGEQLVVSGLDLDRLPCGTRLQIGDHACIELIEPRTGCGKFERHQHKQREEAAGRMGMMARVVRGGEIRIGDSVCVIVAAETQE